MNRIHAATTPPATAPAPSTGGGKLQTIERGQRHAVFVPQHYERNYAYPLLIWLHGPGDDERQLKRIMPHVSLRNYIAAAPRGTLPCRRDDRSAAGHAWCQTPAHLELAEQAIFDTLAAVERKYHVAQSRVFIGGFDCGGTMAFRLAMLHPRRFAGVLSLGGPFPLGRTPLARLGEARRVPLFVACGRESQVYSSQRVCDELRLFHSAGMAVALRLYPCGHELTTSMLADMDRWMMEIITGVSPGAGSD